MQLEGILASTHVDAHGHRITEGALREAANEIAQAPIRLMVEHDPTLPPWGRAARPQLLTMEDGEVALVVQHEPFVQLGQVLLPDGTEAVEYGLEHDNLRLTCTKTGESDSYGLAYDLMDYESEDDLQAFLCEMQEIVPFEGRMLGRKSSVLAPILIVQLPLVAFGWQFARRVGAQVADRLAEDIAEDAHRAYVFATRAPARLLNLARAKGQQVTCVYEVSMVPKVMFAVQSDSASTFERAIDFDELRGRCEEAVELDKALQAVEVHYLWSEDDGWQFNYLLTSSGTVVGTPAAIQRTHRRLQLVIDPEEGGTP